MNPAPAREPALQAAISRLVAASGDLDADARAAHVGVITRALQKSTDVRTLPILLSLQQVVEDGVAPDRFVAILAVLGPDVRAAVAQMARGADRADPFESGLWSAVADVADSVTDPTCGCPIVETVANRRDRRNAARRGVVPATNVTRHRRGCPRTGVTAMRSDPARDTGTTS